MINVEDLVNSCILESREELSRYNIAEFQNLVDSVYTESMMTVGFELAKKVRPDIYIDYLKKVLNNIDTMDIDINGLDNFFTDVYNSLALDDVNLTIPLRSDEEIGKIKPEYLKTIHNDIDVTVRNIIANKVSKGDLDKRFFKDNQYLNKMKNRIVSTTYKVNDVRDLMIMDSPTISHVDNTFIQHNVIPFLRVFTPNINEVRTQIVEAIGQINAICRDLEFTNDSIIKAINSGNISASHVKLLRYFIYNMTTLVMKISSYLTTMLIIKCSYMLYNAKSYVALYNVIKGYFPEMQNILHESVISGNISDIDNTTLLNSIVNGDMSIVIPHVQKAVGLKKMEIANHISRQFNIRLRYDSEISLGRYPYDTRPYAGINSSIMDIMKNLMKFKKECDNNENSIDDIASNTHLNESFLIRYTNAVSNIGNITYYTSQLSDVDTNPDALLSLFNDISSFERNLSIITKTMQRAYNMIDDILKSYDHDLIGSDEIFTNDVRAFVENIMSNYKDYIVNIMRKFMDRLTSLTDLMNDESHDNVTREAACVWSPSNDYTLEAYREKYDDIVYQEKKRLNDLSWEYKKVKNLKERGVKIIREDVKPADNPGGNSSAPKVEGIPKPDNNTNNQQNNSSNTNNSTNGNNSNNNSNTQQQSSQKKPDDKKGLLQRFKDFIDNLVEKFTKKTKDLTTKNDKWLQSVKSKLTSLDTTNVTITVAKYDGLDITKLTTDINTSINKINGINASNPPQEVIKSRGSCEFYLYPSIPEKVGDETSFAGRIKRFYTYGDSDKQELTSYSGNDAKTKIDSMIQFCEGYSKSTGNLTTLIKKLSDAAVKKETEIINSGNKTPTNDTNTNNNSGENKDESPHRIESAISSATREYCGAIPTVLEKKYLDYYKVLYALVGNQSSGDKPETQKGNEEDQKKTN